MFRHIYDPLLEVEAEGKEGDKEERPMLLAEEDGALCPMQAAGEGQCLLVVDEEHRMLVEEGEVHSRK